MYNYLLQREVPPDSWIQTFTGKKLFPLFPEREVIDIRDISHHLAMKVRFNGAVSEFYSVAEHSLLISRFLWETYRNPILSLAGLLHDSAETYLNDISKPLKDLTEFDFYRILEHQWEEVIFDCFGIPNDYKTIIKDLDIRLCDREARTLMAPTHPEWKFAALPPVEIEILALNWGDAERLFLDQYEFLQLKIS